MFIAFSFLLIPCANASSDNARNVHVSKEYVKATALCSCGLNDYHYFTASFENYCPLCNESGTLIFNPKGTPEGEWTCTSCGSDYCAADGKEKMPGSNIFLKHYTVSDKKTKVNAQTVVTTGTMDIALKNQIDLYNNKNFLSHIIISKK
jgi:hypothetical protein